MRSAAELLLPAVAALFAIGLAADGARKLHNASEFARWLSSGGLEPLARRQLVLALGAGELLLGAAAVWPPGRVAAIAAVLLVTPVGALLVHRTGTCACRGVVRSRTVPALVLRNGAVAAMAAVTVLLGAPVPPWVVAACGAGWAATMLGRRLLLGTPVRLTTDGRLPA